MGIKLRKKISKYFLENFIYCIYQRKKEREKGRRVLLILISIYFEFVLYNIFNCVSGLEGNFCGSDKGGNHISEQSGCGRSREKAERGRISGRVTEREKERERRGGGEG